ncbi:hypothetical protein EYM_02810 [Ignicoccus islandicus DSM 13165]|uniref:Fe/B12 periplasmic-binding domain-containing protein n=1 Tax=Ignicoccus islandicus DSM 13165 TaxID=940295 RepID=A0A0U3F9N5_9CREN|nr:helical backbone metal receptor [Ignicoccus islandicus]ALU12361.1 hypothetical protein EYM_02810 [Ignicoccus islandicus DSM 13165]
MRLTIPLILLIAIPTLAIVIVSSSPITLIDALGRNVTIFNYPPKKVIALTPAIAESVCVMNCSKLVATVQPVDWPAQLVNATGSGRVTIIGTFWMPNIEKIALLEPDLVIADEGADLRMIGKLNELGFPVLFTKGGACDSIGCIERDLTLIGKAIGELDRAGEVVKWIEENVTKASEESLKYPLVKVVILFYPFSWGIYAVGNGTFISDLVNKLNAVNLIGQLGWPRITKEKLLSLNADVVILLSGKGIDPQGAVKDAKALGLRAKRICVIYGTYADVVQRPGPRISQAPWILLKALHALVKDPSGLYCSG